MRPLDHLSQGSFRVEHEILLRNHSSCDGEDRPKQTQVKQDCTVRGNLEVQD